MPKGCGVLAAAALPPTPLSMTLRLPHLPRRALFLGALVALTTMVPAMVPAVAQDVKAQKERATGRITEMFCLRLELQLDDLAGASGEPVETFDDAKARAREAVTKWLTEHPVELQQQGPISWNATPIEYEPFTKFVESEGWLAARSEVLTTAQAELLDERSSQRADRAIAALASLIQLRVTQSLCLTEPEEQAIAECCSKAGAKQWENGVIEAFSPYYRNTPVKDTVLEVIDKKDLLAALSPRRQALLSDMLEKGRTSRHGYQLEVEYHLYDKEDAEGQRKLLYGLADALVHRDGQQAKRETHVFAPSKKLAHDRDWLAGLKGVLGQDEELKQAPSRAEKAHIDRRTQYVLAVLDERACFTEEQRESLLPLMKEFVETESLRSRKQSAPELIFPSVLGLSEDGLLIPGENDRFNQPSTKVRALIKTFYEACTPAQQDVLKS